jgi:hypothetical protein
LTTLNIWRAAVSAVSRLITVLVHGRVLHAHFPTIYATRLRNALDLATDMRHNSLTYDHHEITR